MEHAAEEFKQFYDITDDGAYDIGVLGDGTWRRRGFSSSLGIVTVLSLITGKVLDVEVISKEFRECMVWKDKEVSPEFQDLWKAISIPAMQTILDHQDPWML